MYIAQAYLLVPDATGKITPILPGDVIPDFGSWPDLARKAHLNQHLVTEKPEPELMRIEQAFEQNTASEQPAAQPACEPDDHLDAQAEMTVAETEAPVSDAMCTVCDRVFKDASGLKIHQSRVHKSFARQGD